MGSLEAVTVCMVLQVRPGGFMQALTAHRTLRLITCEYATRFHARLTSPAEPNDIVAVTAGFEEMASSASPNVRRSLGMVACESLKNSVWPRLQNSVFRDTRIRTILRVPPPIFLVGVCSTWGPAVQRLMLALLAKASHGWEPRSGEMVAQSRWLGDTHLEACEGAHFTTSMMLCRPGGVGPWVSHLCVMHAPDEPWVPAGLTL